MGRVGILAFGAVAAVLCGAPAQAELRTGQQVVVSRSELIHGDLYAVGGNVLIEGEVDGDVVALGGTVNVRGPVRGDIYSIAGTTTVEAPVGESVRIGSGNATVTAPVGQDLAFAGGELKLERSAVVGRDVLVTGGRAELGAPIQGSVQAGVQELVLAAFVRGDVRARAGRLEVTDKAAVGGTLLYAANKATVSPDARISQVKREPPPQRRGAPVLGFTLGWFRAIIGLTALGVLLALISPRFARALPATLREKPLPSLGWGVVVLICAPIAAAILFFIGALLGGWWLGLIVIVALGIAIALCFPAIGVVLGQWALRAAPEQRGRWFLALLFGVAAVTLALRIPVFGAIVALGTVLFGLGALVMTGARLRQRAPPSAPA